MFNRTIISPPAVNVSVQQQPNDAADAARLYGECVARAEEEVKNAVIMKLGACNELTVVKVKSEGNFETDTQWIRLLFKLNGETFDIRAQEDERVYTRLAYGAVVTKLFENVLNQLMKRLR